MADPVELVISDNDLLTEILVRLPLLSLVLFKSVSKRWYSVIKDAKLSLGRKLDPPSGLFLEKMSLKECHSIGRAYSYDFMPLDNRIPPTNFTFAPEILQQHNNKSDDDDVRILDSCNGLLLCCTAYSRKFYVCNPSITNMFKLLPEPDNVTFDLDPITGGLKLAFDPTKSPHYKIIYAQFVLRGPWVQIHTFSSETGNWSLCGHHFPHFPRCSFNMFGRFGVYWNDAIYWASGVSIFKLDIMNDHPVLTALPTPLTLGNKRSLFESRGRLLLVGNDFGSPQHTIFDKGNLDSEWSLKRIVNFNKVIYPERFTTYDKIVCVVLGERKEDSFLVWRLGTKVVQHKMYPKIKQSKTLSTISDLGPNDKLLRCFQFIPSFANV